jgi:predicted acetyltransferase
LSVDVELRAILADELPAYLVSNSAGFGQPVERTRHNMAAWELDRTVAAFERDRIVGVSRNYSFEITMPGGALLRAAGVSDVSVLPTHRRRGLLRSMMERLLDDAVAHDEPVAMLTASEGGIYGRFGFGVAIRTSTVEVDTRDAVFLGPRPAGTLRMVQLDEARGVEPEVFDRARRRQPGAVSRFDSWWLDEQFQSEFGTRFDVVYESPGGGTDGYLTYGLRGEGTAHGPAFRLIFRELVAASQDATNALWRYACEVDLVRTVVALNAPLDAATGWMFASPRAARQHDIRDFLWTRLLDVPAALVARAYTVPGPGDSGTLVLEVHDAFRPGGRADGRFALEVGPGGSSVSVTSSEPDLVMDVAALSAAWLGGVAFSTLGRAGRVEEVRPGALARADAMFASTPLPVAMTWF